MEFLIIIPLGPIISIPPPLDIMLDIGSPALIMLGCCILIRNQSTGSTHHEVRAKRITDRWLLGTTLLRVTLPLNHARGTCNIWQHNEAFARAHGLVPLVNGPSANNKDQRENTHAKC